MICTSMDVICEEGMKKRAERESMVRGLGGRCGYICGSWYIQHDDSFLIRK